MILFSFSGIFLLFSQFELDALVDHEFGRKNVVSTLFEFSFLLKLGLYNFSLV
jgi:hypothetical protein